MKRAIFILLVMTAVLLYCGMAQAGEESFSFGPFGRVYLYNVRTGPSDLVIFLSGDGGWNKGVVDMAERLNRVGVVVVGIDITRYFHALDASGGTCVYPAADFEALSKYVQKKLRFPRYRLPMLIGYSSGGTLTYAVLAQAPPNTFRGGISMSFCPDMVLNKTLCRGQSLSTKRGRSRKTKTLLPAPKLATRWIVLQGAIDQVCSADVARSFVSRIPQAEIFMLPKVGHGFSVKKRWMPRFTEAYTKLVHQGGLEGVDSGPLNDLPIVEVPAQKESAGFFSIIISGDGGWAGLDREVGAALAQRGVSVAGLNALQYFWTKRTPEGAAEDLARMIRHYLHVWNKNSVILVGYSLGADVLPFMANRLPADLRERVREIALLGPGTETAFEFHLSEWLGRSSDTRHYAVLPEVVKLGKMKVLCVYGTHEQDSVCPLLEPGTVGIMRIPGGHHFGGAFDAIAVRILNEATGVQTAE
jgi:type IV secretory pathway VirJ component